MHESNALPPGGIREQKRTLIDQLNARVSRIAEYWVALTQVNWDPDKLNKLHRHIKDLAADTTKIGLAQISDQVSYLESSLTPLLDSALRPSPQTIDEVFERIRALKSMAELRVRIEIEALEKAVAMDASVANRASTGDVQETQGAPARRGFAPQTRRSGREHLPDRPNGLIASGGLDPGGDYVEVDTPSTPISAPHDDPMCALLQQALDGDGFQIRLQARLDLQSGARAGYEVAPILTTPEGDESSRSDFLPHAGTPELLDRIDRWIIEYALGLMDDRRREGNAVHLFIKQSATALEDGNRLEWLREQLRARHLVGTGLSLEFDLADLTDNLKNAVQCSEILRQMGVSLSLTGFDADPAAFDALAQLPVQFVELHDRIKGLRPETMASVIEKVRGLGAEVITADD